MHRVLAAVIVLGMLVPPVVAQGQMSYTTLGDHDYGNPNKSFNGIGIPAWIDSLVGGDPLVLGMPGRSLTFEDGSEACIVAGLPASGRPAAFPEELGDAVVDSTCELPPDLPANKHGKLKNQLLGEAIALSLNVRLDPDLVDLEVCPWMYTVQGFAGPDSLYGTVDDTMCVVCDTMTIRIPDTVLDAIADSMGVVPTVGTVLDFANMALAGQGIYDASHHDVWHAVKNLNRAFKRCRFLVACEGDSVEAVETFFARESLEGNVAAGHQAAVARPGTWIAASSPVRDLATIRYSVREASHVRIVAYNIAGREVAVVADEAVAAGAGAVELPVDRSRGFASGVYLIRMTATSLVSGEEYAETGKMIVVR
jgi:hypothetical protein